jgi:hypothetical protein
MPSRVVPGPGDPGSDRHDVPCSARAGEHAQLLLSLPAEQRMPSAVQNALERAAAAVQAEDPAAAVALAAAVTQARAASLA